jgi:DNA-binding transcriptional ArsR family regulator
VAKRSDAVMLRDAQAVRAVAHPMRFRIVSLLRREGPATASRLARVLGESSGATSYHLRQLARYGIVVEVAIHGNKRKRWWKLQSRIIKVQTGTGSRAQSLAAAQYRLRILEQDAEVTAQYLEDEMTLSVPWREASLVRNRILLVTPKELVRLHDSLDELLKPFWPENRSAPPPAAKRVYVAIRTLPLRT